jgi:cell wall-associated NlpC family hydrolase
MGRTVMLTLAICALLLPAYVPAQEQAQAPERRVLGKLGQAIEGTSIYKTANSKGATWCKVAEFEYLVINPYENQKWLKVLLTNGKQGFILAETVAQLPYNVTTPQPKGTASRGDVSRALEYSYQYIGTPYKWGGNDISRGIDCSAFVKDVFDKIGVDLPRTAAEQYKVGKAVPRIEDLQPGDRLYFWDKKRNLIGHTGIFTGFREDGGAYFIHSSSNNGGVGTDDLRNPKWRNLLVAARR